MTNEELKQQLADSLQIPAGMISGETPEELIAHARALLAYKRQMADQNGVQPEKKPNRDLFAAWLNGDVAALGPEQVLAKIEAEAVPHYPSLQDSGEVQTMQQAPTPRQQFAEWMGQPHRGNPYTQDQWHPIC